MKFIMKYTLKPGGTTRNQAIDRFKRTGGQPPKGVKLLGRWTKADFSGGYELLESDDPRALTELSLMWSDLMELEISPVIEDKELSQTLERVEEAVAT